MKEGKNETFALKGYDCVEIPRRECIINRPRGKRGHGGVCLFISQKISNGVHVLEMDENGLMWVKICKDFFPYGK